ncbi:unnamed protein product, partial [Rotaria sp. Silwood1]
MILFHAIPLPILVDSGMKYKEL